MSKTYEASLELSWPLSDWRNWVILGGVLVLSLLALYLVGFDQGFLLALFQGKSAYQMNMIHELIHDSRHIAAFPCH
jgi:hypothetical protein